MSFRDRSESFSRADCGFTLNDDRHSSAVTNPLSSKATVMISTLRAAKKDWYVSVRQQDTVAKWHRRSRRQQEQLLHASATPPPHTKKPKQKKNKKKPTHIDPYTTCWIKEASSTWAAPAVPTPTRPFLSPGIAEKLGRKYRKSLT